jgi:AAA+ ATPase superfamily predicted ATPase
VVVLGRRMTGKTSLVKTFAREKSGLYVSLMGVKNLVGLAEALLQSPGLELKELELGPATLLRLKLTKTMENIFSRLEGKVVVLDEVQELVSPAFLKLLKTMWDTSRGLRLIFTGSYAGVLKRMLEPGKGSPLYGRQPARIELIQQGPRGGVSAPRFRRVQNEPERVRDKGGRREARRRSRVAHLLREL